MVTARLQFDYTTVGHVTADVLVDGSRRPGGSAFYSALQAARLGQRTLIVTRGVPREIEELLGPYRQELELELLAAPQTTTLAGVRPGPQRVLAWAGEFDGDLRIDTSILHLAPIARETPGSWRGSAAFVGLTPQGLIRAWSGEGAELVAAPPEERRVPRRCQALVLSEHEREGCRELIATARSEGAVAVVTAGASPATVLLPGEEELAVPVPALDSPVDDVGAGDVFAAAFFVALAGGEQPRAAAEFANAAAAVRISGSGARAIGDRTAIENRLRAVSRA